MNLAEASVKKEAAESWKNEVDQSNSSYAVIDVEAMSL